MAKTQGGAVELDRASMMDADRIRSEQEAARKKNTRRRHGNNGSRKWGTESDPWGWHEDADR